MSAFVFADGNTDGHTSPEVPADGTAPTPLVIRDAPDTDNAPVALVETVIDSTARNGQVRLSYSFPTYQCPNNPEESQRLQACVARDPSPLGNIVLDVGHSDHTAEHRDAHGGSADRSSGQKNLHEGHITFASALMTKNMLETCYGLPSEDIQLTRYPRETEYGTFNNSQYAETAIERFQYRADANITAELENDAAQRRAYVKHLLGATDAERKRSIMVSVHANAAGGDYVSVIYDPNAPNGKSRELSDSLTDALVAQIQPSYIAALESLRARETELTAQKSTPAIRNELSEVRTRISVVELASRTRKAHGNKGTSRPIPRSLGIVSDSSYGSTGAAMALAEGFFMDGTLGKMADAEIKKNKEQVGVLYDVYRQSAAGTARELALKNLNDKIRESTVGVNQEVYDEAQGKWVRKERTSYNVAGIFINYAKGLSAGIVAQALDQCS